MPSTDLAESRLPDPTPPVPIEKPAAPTSSPGAPRASQRFAAHLRRQQTQFADLWRRSPRTCPDLGRAYDRRQQGCMERLTDDHLDLIEQMLRAVPTLPRKRPAWRRRLESQLRNTAVECLHMDPRQSRLVFNDRLFDVTLEFARRARRLDPSVEMIDLAQAWRNLWVMNLFQMLLDRPVELSPSVFAYSMLYPYTDNPLDDPGAPVASKLEIGARLEDRLSGRSVAARGRHEALVFELVAQIEGELDRQLYPEVYCSLLAIHRAQIESLEQHGGREPDAARLLDLSVAKGGASVLADGYLVSGRPRQEEADFFFGYGVLLQLADDLQDVAEDLEAGHATLFTRAAAEGPLDELVCQLCHFQVAVLDGCESFSACRRAPLRALMHDACIRLIVQSVGQQRQFFSEDFYRQLDRHSPTSFSYARRQKKLLGRRGRRLRDHLGREKKVESLFDLLA